jgi:membrane-bound ClpP family serine protease
MSLTLIILLIIGGLLFVMLEILVMPGVAVIGIFGGIMIIAGIVSAYYIDAMHGHIALGGSLILTILIIFLSIRGKTWKNISLQNSIEGKVNIFDEKDVNVGDHGIAVSRLNPMGKAIINEVIYEVQSLDGFLAENTKLKVVKIEGFKILVKRESEESINN